MNTDEALRLIFEKASDETTAYGLLTYCWKAAFDDEFKGDRHYDSMLTEDEFSIVFRAFYQQRPSKPQAWRIADEIVRKRITALEKFKSVKVASYSRAQRLVESMKQPGFIALPDGGRGVILRVA